MKNNEVIIINNRKYNKFFFPTHFPILKKDIYNIFFFNFKYNLYFFIKTLNSFQI